MEEGGKVKGCWGNLYEQSQGHINFFGYIITQLGLTVHTTLISGLSHYKDRNLVVSGIVCIPYSVFNSICLHEHTVLKGPVKQGQLGTLVCLFNR